MTGYNQLTLSSQIILTLCSIVALFLLQVEGDGSLFLGRREGHVSQSSSSSAADDVDLLEQLEKVAGRESRNVVESRLEPLEEALRPMYAAMPKNSAGSLDSAAVRYILHRFFVQRHGWFVRGLHNVGETWNSSSPAGVFKEHAGNQVHNLFADHLSSYGFGLRQVAIFAATLESFVHEETLERLRTAHRVVGLPKEQQHLESAEAEKVIKVYMLMYVLEINLKTVTSDLVTQAFEQIETIYPTWPATVHFLEEVRQSVVNGAAGTSVADWSTMVKVLEEFGMRYGHWQNHECVALKRTLMEIEKPGTGRVPLASFYGSALNNGSWQFMESVPYLRQLGALDDSDPAQMSVIIPNYINSPSNCVASSKFYKVCCIDECDSLLGHLEAKIGASHASPRKIAALVSALSSDTVSSPRTLPAGLVWRLEDIAGQHDGHVPLHGRLFAQWMHHAYPRECGYPHVTGTTKPLEPLEFAANTGEEHTAQVEDMRHLVDEQRSRNAMLAPIERNSDFDELPWTAEEELVVAGASQNAWNDPRPWGFGKGLLYLAAPCSMTFMVLRLIVSADEKVASQRASKYNL